MTQPFAIRHRLLLVTLATAGITVAASGFVLSALFRHHVQQQFVDRLTSDLEQVLARLEVDARGLPSLDPSRLSDPRWTRPHSGLYWQVDAAGPEGARGLLRSRSLWDEDLDSPRDHPSPGQLHVHEVLNHQAQTLLLIERSLHVEGARQPWRVMVAASTAPLAQAAAQFDQALMLSLLSLLALMCGAAFIQVRLGLTPLRHLRDALAALRDGKTSRLEGRHPDEIQPLVDDLNKLLDLQAASLERARTQAGNLAHALKTPLAILSQGAAQAAAGGRADELSQLVIEQVQLARRHIDGHLARARAAAAHVTTTLKTPIEPVAQGLVRVMRKVHADRHVDIHLSMPEHLVFAGEAQDLQEMLGNLLDNACKAARSRVQVCASADGAQCLLSIDDDGAGIEPGRRTQALQRGARLDETTPGSGLGLAIVQELAILYGGTLSLESSELGGLRALLRVPAG